VGLLAIIDHATPKSGYYQVKLTPRFFVSFLSNLPYRIRDILLLRPDQFAARVARKLRVLRKIVRPGPVSKQTSKFQVNADEVIDDASNLMPAVQKVIETNYKAIMDYVPGKYDGTLTLLRARGGRLLVSQDPLMGWKQYVKNIKVRIISGSHIHIFHPQHVQHLARQLSLCLDENQVKEP
jgi:hypothetical protein